MVRKNAITDPDEIRKLVAKHQLLDGRLHETPFDPSIPYYLNEKGSLHNLTGRRHDNQPNGA